MQASKKKGKSKKMQAIGKYEEEGANGKNDHPNKNITKSEANGH